MTRRQMAKMKGLLWGAYHLGRPGNPREQADHFVDFAEPRGGRSRRPRHRGPHRRLDEPLGRRDLRRPGEDPHRPLSRALHQRLDRQVHLAARRASIRCCRACSSGTRAIATTSATSSRPTPGRPTRSGSSPRCTTATPTPARTGWRGRRPTSTSTSPRSTRRTCARPGRSTIWSTDAPDAADPAHAGRLAGRGHQGRGRQGRERRDRQGRAGEGWRDAVGHRGGGCLRRRRRPAGLARRVRHARRRLWPVAAAPASRPAAASVARRGRAARPSRRCGRGCEEDAAQDGAAARMSRRRTGRSRPAPTPNAVAAHAEAAAFAGRLQPRGRREAHRQARHAARAGVDRGEGARPLLLRRRCRRAATRPREPKTGPTSAPRSTATCARASRRCCTPRRPPSRRRPCRCRPASCRSSAPKARMAAAVRVSCAGTGPKRCSCRSWKSRSAASFRPSTRPAESGSRQPTPPASLQGAATAILSEGGPSAAFRRSGCRRAWRLVRAC